MGGASPSTLNSLHCPLIYMTGGTGDVAYENAKTDYNKVKKAVPEVSGPGASSSQSMLRLQ